MTKSIFFETVAKHNLERFHSEVIAWIFNNFPAAARNFIMYINPRIKTIDSIKLEANYCLAEKNQIDILLTYFHNDKKHQIIIENKMKSSESEIDIEKIKRKLVQKIDLKKRLNSTEVDFLESSSRMKLSQTEFYFLRDKLERDSKIEQNNCHYVFLKPSRISKNQFSELNSNEFDIDFLDYDFDQLNNWNKLLGPNPWTSVTYQEYTEVISANFAIDQADASEGDKMLAKSYIEYITDKIKEDVDLTDFKANEVHSRYEYFRFMFHLVKSKLQIKNPNNKLEFHIYPGSSNGGMPLFAFYKTLNLPKSASFLSTAPDTINIGIQLQGENLKYYISATDYDNVTVDFPIVYVNFVEEILEIVTSDMNKSKNVEIKIDFEKLKNSGFNPNKNKTFYSRSYKIQNFITTDDASRSIDDIALEIYQKVNHFSLLDIQKIVNNSSHLN